MLGFRFGGRGGGPDPAESALLVFRDLWRAGEPSLEKFWSGLGPERSPRLLSALAKVELKARFERGERPRAAEILGRFPDLAEDSDRVVSLVYEEFCLLEERGEEPSSAEFCEVYAPWGDSLRSQLVYHRELSRGPGPSGPPTKFPKPGDRFASYHLRSLLGKGGAAHVFLAIEEDLGGRKVALKISPSVGREPSILANLDHPNVVPIHSITETTEDGLRGFCMPYRPGITLEDLIRRLGRGKPGRRASLLWKALVPDAQAPDALNRPGWAGFPIRGTFDEAVAWLGAALAEAVQYLHENRVVHRDIKPANILLADREGPQLLDFHLAYAPNAPDHAQAALNGGTLPYMAPEQLRAFLDPRCWDLVGESADIYALGLVLREMVTGRGPELPEDGLPLARAIDGLLERRREPCIPVRDVNPSVPPSLAAIIEMCLAPDPDERYRSAGDLAADLRLFLARRPLAKAPNTSPIERLANFIHRHWMKIGALVFVLATAIPARNGAPARVDFPESEEARGAIADLDSDDPGGWRRAKAVFERFRRDEPRSAFPPLYLSQACEKLSETKRVNLLIEEAETCPDFDRAIERRLREKPTSITLMVVESTRLIARKRYQAAADLLEKVRQVEPSHRGAMVAAAKLERSRGNPGRAIAHYRAAIESASKESGTRESILSWRLAILSPLHDQAASELAHGNDPRALDRAAGLLSEMASEIALIDREGRTSPVPRGMEKWEFTRNFYTGVMETGLGEIDRFRPASGPGDGKIGSAGLHFDRAREHLELAGRSIAPGDPNGANMRASVERHLRSLRARSGPRP